MAGPDDAALDATALLSDTRNVLLMADGGGIIFAWHEPGIYEVHTNFLPAWRGRHALRATLTACRWMFTRTDCMTLLTRVPAFNRAAEWLCAKVGGTKEFERTAAWPTKTGMVDLSFWALRYDDWVRKTPDLAMAGREFHDRLDTEFARHGVLALHHPEEFCHNLYVGACVEMIYGGQPLKAVVLYDRWARFAGYAAIGLVSTDPLILDIGDAVLQVYPADRTFKVLKCR